MKKTIAYAVTSIAALCLSSSAQSAALLLSVNINVWSGTSANPGDINDPSQAALPSNPLTSQNYLGFYSYTGAFDFEHTSQATDFMDTWIPGIGLPHQLMSLPGFNQASLWEFTFVAPSNISGASLTHDDGVSFYDITTSSANLIPGNSGPTQAATTALPDLIAGHNYELWYVASNGAPSILTFSGATAAVPEPASWAAMTLGFGVLGGALRRRRSLGSETKVSFG